MRFPRFAAVALAVSLALMGSACAPDGSEPTGPAPTSDVAVALHTDSATVDRDVQPLSLRFVVTNFAAESRHVLVYNTPLDGIDADILQVERDGVAVPYQGKIVKTAAPVPEDFVEIGAGETLAVAFDPSEAYDMSLPGRYTVRYRAAALVVKAPERTLLRLRSSDVDYQTIDSDTVTVALKGQGQTPEEKTTGGGKPGGGGNTCNSTQLDTADTAKANALTMTTNALTSLAALDYTTPEELYTTWFGASTAARYSNVEAHYTDLVDAFTNQPITFDCSCKKRYYAYVYPNQPYKVYLCNIFWLAEAIGRDSQAGTLVHEVSHFDVVAATDDFVYGESLAKNLALTNPDQATNNADSHEYFAEDHLVP